MFDRYSLVLVGASLVLMMALLRPAFLRDRTWRATVTPLASIIGSGFLVIAPLLHGLAGRWSLLAIGALVLVAFSVGGVIRANVRYEAVVQADPLAHRVDRASSFLLGIAYVISVAFYVALLAAFSLNAFGLKTPETIRWFASAILVVLAAVGWIRGLDGYEGLEATSVSIKLAIIGGLLLSLALFGATESVPYFQHESIVEGTLLERLQILGGLLMVAQGFETSRYLGDTYDTETRVRTMRNAQWISGAIYFAFIGLTCPLFFLYPLESFDETGVSLVLGNVIVLAPLLLLIAAAASQFSAAIADIVGASGLVRETLGKALSVRTAYLWVIGVSLILIWTLDVFEIVTWASRGFAAYYALQTALLLIVLKRDHSAARRLPRSAGACVLFVVLAFVVVAARTPH